MGVRIAAWAQPPGKQLDRLPLAPLSPTGKFAMGERAATVHVTALERSA